MAKTKSITGKLRSKSILNNATTVISRNHLNANKSKMEVKKKMEKGNRSESVRRDLRLEIFESKRINAKPRKPNQVQRGSTIDITPALLGQVRINDLKSNAWIPKIHRELDARGVKYDPKMKLKKVRNLILLHEYDGNIPDGEEGKLFYPRWSSVAMWETPELDEE